MISCSIFITFTKFKWSKSYCITDEFLWFLQDNETIFNSTIDDQAQSDTSTNNMVSIFLLTCNETCLHIWLFFNYLHSWFSLFQENLDIEGRRIINFNFFMNQLLWIDKHGEKFGTKYTFYSVFVFINQLYLFIYTLSRTIHI